MATLAQQNWWLLQHVPAAVFVFCFGACVGSFLNVVIYRLPAGISVISPPSRCPVCGARLRFFRENLPILGWFMVRGKCRYCGVRISAQYMLVECLVALLCLGLYWVLFTAPPGTTWWSEIGGAWWYQNTIFRVWPVFFLWTFLLAGLIAMTVIDARTFTIPIEIPLFITIAAVIAYPAQTFFPIRLPSVQTWPIPGAGWHACAIAALGVTGVIASNILLRAGILKHSFADYYEYVDEDDTVGDYPHARREMRGEFLFLLPIIIGVVAGYFVGDMLPDEAPPKLVQALGATLLGYLAGAGIIWAVRMFGTLGFGREAMGLGDVHLLGAIGAVLGWFDAIIIFFLAPFSGIVWHLVSKGLTSIFRTSGHELPYGPHLAAATILVIVGRPGLEHLWAIIMPAVNMPAAGFVP